MKTRLVSFFFIIGLLPMKAQITEQYYDINNTCWRFTELTDYGCSAARITEIAGNVPGDIVIPSSVSAGEDSYLVTEVGEYVFSGKKNIASINIPNTIQVIGYNAFYECSNLYSVMIPSIEDWCKIYFNGYYSNPLRYATRLLVGGKVYTSLEIPETVTTLNSYVFAGFKELKSIVLPDNLIAIGQYAFENCSNLTTAVLPTQLTSIGPSAFHGCKAMTSLELPDGLASIGDNSFTGCSGLTNIVIPSSVSSIGKFAFYGCDNLQTVTVKNSLPLTLTEGTFSDITNTTLYVPSGSKAAYEAADYWKEFKEIIESSPIITFADPNVKNLCVANWDTDGDGELSEAEAAAVSDLGEVFKGNTSITSFDELVYFNGLTSIGKNAFLGCSSLASVVMGDGMTSIGEGAFQECSSLVKTNIPSTVTSIGATAFSGCSGMTSVVIGDGVTSIGKGAFSGCSSLLKLTLPKTVVTIDNYAFQGCRSMTSVDISDGVTSIGEGAFQTCSSLLKIILPKSLTSIGSNSFSDCSSLSSITIPESVSSIGYKAFANCSSLTTISIPEGVTSIGSEAFKGCSKMNSVSIPKSLAKIGSSAFISCNNLKSVHITDLEAWCNISFANELSNPLYYAHDLYLNGEELRELIIPDAITNIKNCSFFGCGSITSVTIPNHVTSIGEAAFLGCNAVKYLTLPNNLMMIKQNSFDGCTSLQSVTIPASVEYIYQSAFANCSRLQEVRVLATTPPFAYDNTFSNYNVTLSVPEASIGSYHATSPWSNFTTLQTLSGEEPTIEKCEKPTILYANGELTFGCATEGVEFHWTITNGADSSGNGSKVSFTPKTTVSVYVSKDGYKDSDTATLDINGSGGLKGDVNNNGGIDIGDAVTIVNYLVGKTATLSRGTGVNENMKEPQ